jgi:hypothetical protein
VYATKNETETFRFIHWKDFSPHLLTLPIDKIVAEMVINQKCSA